MTLITTIIPFYNEAYALPRCVDSVLKQTHEDLQIILADDGSTDASGAIADDYARRDSRVTALHLEKSGVSAARNAGLAAMRGEFVHFVDADDYVTDTLVEHLLTDIVREQTDF